VEKELSYTVGKNITVQSFWKTVWRVHKKLKIAIPLMSICVSKGNEFSTSKRYLHVHVYCSTIHNSQDMELTIVFMGWQMDKENVIYMHNGLLIIYL
jgi:hypothetical protein